MADYQKTMSEEYLADVDEESAEHTRGASADSEQTHALAKQRRVLVIEDNVDDVEMIERYLDGTVDVEYVVESADRLSVGLKRLDQGEIHVLLLDLQLPDSFGIETFQKVHTHAQRLPIIVLTGMEDELVGTQIMREGAADYLVKGEFDADSLVRSITYARARHNISVRLSRALKLAKTTEANVRNIITSNIDGIIVVNDQGMVQFSNPAADVLFGRKAGELIGGPFGLPLVIDEVTEVNVLRSGGGMIPVEIRCVEIDWEGKPAHLAMLHDLTQQKQAEVHQARLASIVNSTDDAILSADLEGNLLSWNAGAEQVFGYSADEAVGKHASILWSPEHCEGAQAVIEQVKRGEAVRQHETVRVHKDGRKINISLSVSPIRDARGEVVSMAGILSDITDRKQAEQALRESETLFRTLTSTAPVVIWLSDANHQITYANERWAEATGEPVEQDLGEGWMDRVHPDDSEELIRTFCEAHETQRNFGAEYRVRTHDGSFRWLLEYAVPRIGSTGEFLGFVGSAMDITESKQAEAQLKSSEERLRSVAETANDAIVLADDTSHIISWNPGAQTIFGYCEEEVFGKPLTMLMPERYRETHTTGFERYAKTGESRVIGQPVELDGLRKDGSEFPLELSLSTWKTAEGQFYCGIIRDITERKRAEEHRIAVNIARNIQQDLFPSDSPSLPGFDIAGAVFPAEQVSGDYFDFIPMTDESLGVVVADVSGHGVGPALLMAQTQAYLRSLAETRDDPAEILNNTHRLLPANDTGRFVTLFFAVIDPRTRSLVYSSAGHRGYLLNAQGEMNKLNPRGTPLGITGPGPLTCAPAVKLEPGDLILLPTDGIIETITPDKTMFGELRMLEICRTNRERSAREIVESLYQATCDHAQGQPQSDDITAVVIKVV